MIEYGLLIGGTLLLFGFISFLLRRGLSLFIKKNSNGDDLDPTNFVFLKNSISLICYSIALFWIFSKIPYFKSLGNALFASAGVFAAVLGFAAQKAFANIVGGIFILIFKPFRIGDNIQVGTGFKGSVEEITLRHTVIKDLEFRRVIIPNSSMSEATIVNSTITDKKIRKHIELSISYESNLELAESIIRRELSQHPLALDHRTKEEIENNIPMIQIRLIRWAESSIVLRAYVWARNFDDSLEIKWDVLRSIKLAFDANGVEIPYPHQMVIQKKVD